MTGKTVAEKWSKLFVLKSFEGETRVVFTREAFDTGGYEVLSNIIRDLRMDEDFVYEQVWNALEAIAENELEDVEGRPWAYYVVDVYTSNLIAWLASSVNHVRYLDDVVGDDVRDGAHLLMQAQGAAIEEIWQAVVSAVQDEVNQFDPFYEEE